MLWGVVLFVASLDDERARCRGSRRRGAVRRRGDDADRGARVPRVCGGVTVLGASCGGRGASAPAVLGVALLAGAAVPLLANESLERLMLGGTIRASRAAGTAADVGVSARVRVQEAFTTLVGHEPVRAHRRLRAWAR